MSNYRIGSDRSALGEESRAPDFPGSYFLRVVCFACCLPSGALLLAKMYGLAPMSGPALWIAVTCCVALFGLWAWARWSGRQWLVEALEVGFLGGLVGTLAYDLVRVPFHLAGQRVFAPIGAYGVWILDAESSSRYTHTAGWIYHFSNGITFGMMYAIFMRGRHWAWAVLWAFTLETIAVTCPFGRVFSLSGNYPALAIAYFGHVAFGIPLGWLVYRWNQTVRWLSTVPKPVVWSSWLLAGAAMAGPLVSPAARDRDARAAFGTFRIEGHRLNPDWLRIDRGDSVEFFNPGLGPAAIAARGQPELDVAADEKQQMSFPGTGVYPVHVKTKSRSHSSFILVEPVEASR